MVLDDIMKLKEDTDEDIGLCASIYVTTVNDFDASIYVTTVNDFDDIGRIVDIFS